jgi:uncharacterized protein (TIGR02569 family)
VTTGANSDAGPGQEVLAAFGMADELVRAEGKGVFRVGRATVTRVEDPELLQWRVGLYERLGAQGYRVPATVRTHDGELSASGWSAALLPEGRPGTDGDWDRLFQCSAALHEILVDEPKPTFLARARDRWSIADRVAWGEEPDQALPSVRPLLERLEAELGPVDTRPRLIDANVSGNLLFTRDGSVAIAGCNPKWRPAGYADGIAVMDGWIWYGADAGVPHLARHSAGFPQLLLRAAIFRLMALSEEGRTHRAEAMDQLPLFEKAVDRVVCHLRERADSTLGGR